MDNKQFIPLGFYSITPYLVVRNASSAIEFYKKAFNASELVEPLLDPDNNIITAQIKIGNSPILITEENENNPSPQSLHGSSVRLVLHVEDVDKINHQAIEAGATVLIKVADQFYGERAGRLLDPFGHIWIISTFKESLSAQEIQKRANILYGLSEQ
ncbi:MAG: VOC family protein [Alphaproteobacteria bacterium]|nr:VOC family protein [Alphaproteobacteria bacterium]